jgi:hypothetical protein
MRKSADPNYIWHLSIIMRALPAIIMKKLRVA